MDGKVLLIDNSSYERQKVKHILNRVKPLETVEVQGLKQLGLIDLAALDVCLVIADIALPSEEDGFEMLKMLRGNRAAASVPIIIVTKTDKPEVKAAALKYSVNDYILKPYQVKRLEKSILSVINVERRFYYDTGDIENITLSFDDYMAREIKYSLRSKTPLSFILITTLKLSDKAESEPSEVPGGASEWKTSVFPMAAEKAKKSLRATDTVILGKDRDIVIILPCTDSTGAAHVCQKLHAGIFSGLENLNPVESRQIYPVHVTFPEDGGDFQALMETAFKKVSDKEMLEKIGSIPANTLKYVDRSYNRYRKWF